MLKGKPRRSTASDEFEELLNMRSHTTSRPNRRPSRRRLQTSGESFRPLVCEVGWAWLPASARLIWGLFPSIFIIWGLFAPYGGEFLIPFGVFTLLILGWSVSYPYLFYRPPVVVFENGFRIFDIDFAWEDILEIEIVGDFRDRPSVAFTYSEECKRRLKAIPLIHRFQVGLYLPPVSLLSDGNVFSFPTLLSKEPEELMRILSPYLPENVNTATVPA